MKRPARLTWPWAAGAAVVLVAGGLSVALATRNGDGGAVQSGFTGPVPTAARPDVLAPAPTATPAPAPAPAATTPVAGDGGTASPSTTIAPTAPPANPDEIDARICGGAALQGGPATYDEARARYAGRSVVRVPPGDNGKLFDGTVADTVYWFEAGTHTLGRGEFAQLVAKPGDVFTGAPGAVLDGQRSNRYAFGGNVADVLIEYLTIANFVAPLNEGVVNHDSGNDWQIEHTTISGNDGAGMMAGARQHVRYSCLAENGQYGFNAYQGGDGIAGLVFEHNEIAGNNTGDWERKQKGCGCTGGGKFWSVVGARITNNWVHDNRSVGLWADTNNVDFLFERNIVEGNDGVGIWYEISYNARIALNLIARNGWAQGKIDQGAPAPGVYLSEAGGDSRLPATNAGAAAIDITANRFVDDYSGITLYENANRFCNSNGNSSTGYCTPFVTKGVIAEPHDYTYGRPVNKAHPCNAPGIGGEPLYTDCRWRTQHVTVHDNDFSFDRSVVPCASEYCGVMALYVSGADNQTWQPYRVADVAKAVVGGQDNRWRQNRYTGAWRFAVEFGDRTDWKDWQGRLAQDAESTYAG